jgi:hypothetical protein
MVLVQTVSEQSPLLVSGMQNVVPLGINVRVEQLV